MNTPKARLDLQRFKRLGMVEAIWGEHKTAAQIAEILETLRLANEFALVTRVQLHKAKDVQNLIKEVTYHSDAKCLTMGDPLPLKPALGKVIVLSGGISDLQIAKETELALHCHGIVVELLVDVGVAGLHRLLSNLEKIKEAKALIACAGMEGALPTIITGLVPQPVVGVPVSVGYGVSSGGNSALQGMLSSCAPGLTVVNIDNGYGAAMAAIRILKS